ncbi:hypothetical protein EXT64_12535 [Pectobacterium atrosepticum]|nr:hypothetical protein EIP93_16040 [Pectobacterium versatile]MCL6338418.1 hypothetical protein [Pectobacterium carotovorum subsp. carotovorum]MCL6342871.1 hypothetical protein [Pectobacterium carotovorum subsp. carotovorum]MCL6373734.1 hypothetical protein [Pectobacterium atrosepticum]TAI99790.1 hypothetical protein EG332_04045 [Pectobacterium versatile]
MGLALRASTSAVQKRLDVFVRRGTDFRGVHAAHPAATIASAQFFTPRGKNIYLLHSEFKNPLGISFNLIGF